MHPRTVSENRHRRKISPSASYPLDKSPIEKPAAVKNVSKRKRTGTNGQGPLDVQESSDGQITPFHAAPPVFPGSFRPESVMKSATGTDMTMSLPLYASAGASLFQPIPANTLMFAGAAPAVAPVSPTTFPASFMDLPAFVPDLWTPQPYSWIPPFFSLPSSSSFPLLPTQAVVATPRDTITTMFKSLSVHLPDSPHFPTTKLTLRDISRLYENRYLNGDLVNFQVQLHALRHLADEDWNTVYLGATFTYQVIGDKKYPNIKNVNLFSKEFLIMPVNENEHWMLMVLINPAGAIEKEDGSTDGECRMVVFNSMPFSVPMEWMFLEKVVHQNMQNWLDHIFEFHKKKYHLKGVFNPNKIKLEKLEVQELLLQTNIYDCGLFTGFFAKAIFSKFADFKIQTKQQAINLLDVDPGLADDVSCFPRLQCFEEIFNLVEHPEKELLCYDSLGQIDPDYMYWSLF